MKKTFLLISIFSVALFSGCSSDDPQPSFEEQLAIDEGLIETYLATNNITAQEDESGIRYVINRQGIGENPSVGDRIAVKFSSYNLLGENRGENLIGITLDLNESAIFEAWTLMLPEIAEAGKITIYCPSGYVYGATGGGLTQPNEVVVFEIELIAVIDSEEEQLAVDSDIIGDFLIDNTILAATDPSGHQIYNY